MAEAAAEVGLVASIASLIDLSAKVAARLHEFASHTSEVPDSFRELSTRLPVLNSSLQAISGQAQAGRLSQDVGVALQAVISSTSTQVTTLQACLSNILPPTDASQVQRAVKALKSLAKEKEVQTAVQKIHQDIDFLVLHQSTRHVDNGERILEELAQLRLASGLSSSPTTQAGNSYPDVSAHDHSNVHLGDVNVYYQEPEKSVFLGWLLSSAPLIDPDHFVGRTAELDSMQDILRPSEASIEQRRLVLGGIGGIGKTQLAIAYARRYQQEYTSVLWLNATSELTLKVSFRSVMQGVIKAEELEELSDEQVILRVHQWLSNKGNAQWLLIFDNYDDPDQLNINDYIPYTIHGSVIITTRSPDLVHNHQVRLQPLQDIDESLYILQARSRRQGVKDGKSTEADSTMFGLRVDKYIQMLMRNVWRSAWEVFPWPWSLPVLTF